MLYTMYIVYLRKNNIIMESLKRTIVNIFIALCMLLCFACDDKTNEDWSEIVTMYVASEVGEYVPWGVSEDVKPVKGLRVREEGEDVFYVIGPLSVIDGFVYEEGFEYCLRVEKIHLSNPPMDVSNINYRLVEILWKK